MPGSDVYAGGYFTTAGGSAANSIAKWNGSSWTALGAGISGVDGVHDKIVEKWVFVVFLS
ncbi:MAG: hypothetical protein AUI33_01280 [Ignavibacteria bacterium 13_1_40CM_2_61_4]|nr:MAG: hypothetical protein AUI33_01280 [Ignavibacteria bacterium 13_1_40CM_2_61_4]